MAAGPKGPSKRRGTAITGRRFTSAKPARRPTETSPSRLRKMQARSSAPGKEVTQKPARGRVQTRRKTTVIRGAGQKASVVTAQLEAIAHRLEQITEMRAELAEMRTIVEELAESVATLVANSAVQEGDLEQAVAVVTDEVLIIETNDVSTDEEEGPSR
jgi:di/tripeptidase